MKYKTYQDWLNDGYQVRKGEKPEKKDANNNILFSEKQVDAKKTSKEYDDEYEGRLDEDYDMDGWGH